MNYNKLYIFILLTFISVVAFLNTRKQRENFDAINHLLGKVNSAIGDIGNIATDLGSAMTSIPRVAQDLATNTFNLAVAPAKQAITDVNRTIKGVERDIKNLFDTIEEVFNKVKYFAELLIFLLERGVTCAKGAQKVSKNYKLATDGKLAEIKALHEKLQTCTKNPIRIPRTYWRNCVTQIGPFMKRLYEFSNILIKFYKEVLTYVELFPQGENKAYCASEWRKAMSQTQALVYGKRCNSCLHLKSIMKLGLKELQEFGKVINDVFKITKLIETQINEVANFIKI